MLELILCRPIVTPFFTGSLSSELSLVTCVEELRITQFAGMWRGEVREVESIESHFGGNTTFLLFTGCLKE